MKHKFITILILGSLLYGCEEAPDHNAGKPKDSVAPAPVSNVMVENLPGGAKIRYTLPGDVDLLGVKALYSYTSGSAVMESYASAFTDSIVITGFPDTSERIVRLIAIDESQNESEPVNVTINPGTPPVELIFQSLSVSATFGGVLVQWDNEAGAEVGISLYAADENGDMNLDYTYFTNQSEAYSFRGFDDTERKFEIQIRDRWDNYSGIKTVTLKPLFEVHISPKNESGIVIWKRYGYDDRSCIWRGDAPNEQNANRGFNKICDGIFGVGTDPNSFLNSAPPGNMLGDYTGKPEDANTAVVPMYMTIDLGRSCKLSRHKFWFRTEGVFRDNSLRQYELWATNETPKGVLDFATKEESLAYWTSWDEVGGTDGWKNDWVKIADCRVAGPVSGATELADITEEDKTVANANGFEFDILPDQGGTPFRYIRMVSQRTWAGGTIFHIGEFQFWGAYDD